MATASLSIDSDAPGKGGSAPLFGAGRPQKVITGKITFGTNYPAGGVDISDVFDCFIGVDGTSHLQGMVVEEPIVAGSHTGKHVKVDYTAQTLMALTNAIPYAEVANDSDQTGMGAVHFIAWGPR